MAHKTVAEAREKMQKSLLTFEEEIVHIRSGRASTGLVDAIEVDAYGQKMRLNQMASITVPEPRLITIQPWDKSMLGTIEKAIFQSPLACPCPN
jgi:ribosome recycling factor